MANFIGVENVEFFLKFDEVAPIIHAFFEHLFEDKLVQKVIGFSSLVAQGSLKFCNRKK